MKTFKEISEKLKKDKDDPCWKGYVQVGMKKKDGKEVPNCVPKEGVDEKKDTHKTKDGRTAKKGLWYNINQKKKRGEAPAKKGDPDYPKTLNIESIEEKAVSKQQQKFMGMVRAVQKGEMDAPSPEVAKAAKSMTKKDVKDFAKTKHKGLPDKVDEALTLADIRRKKEREERRKKEGRDGETQRQRMMRKVYGAHMGGLKKGYGESVEAGIVESTDASKYMWKDINAALSSAGINPGTIARVLSNLKGKSTK